MRLFTDNMFATMVRTAWQHAGTDRPKMVLYYALFLAANIIIMMQPVILAQLINVAQKGGADALPQALRWAGAYAGLTLTFWCLHGPARVIERRTAFGIYHRFVTALYKKVTEMPLRWHQDHHSGGTINRVNKAGRALFVFADAQFVLLQVAIRFTASVCLLAFYSLPVAAVSLLSSTIIILIIRRFDKTLMPLVREGNEREHYLNAGLYDYIGNIITVLTLRMQGNTGNEINHRFAAMKPPFWAHTLLNEKKWFFLNFLLITTQASIVGGYIGFHLAKNLPMMIGSVVAIFQYLLNINMLFFQGTLGYETLLNQHTDLHGIDGLLADHARLGSVRPAATTQGWCTIGIDTLNFTHREGEDVLHHLRDVSFGFSAGQKIALIGSSGSGKTTLLTLLRGLYDAKSVRLKIDDAETQSLAPLAGFTTLVPQDAEIFENTVRYNLTLGTEVAEDTIQKALHISAFDEVVPKLPQGLDTDIRERGVNLSGGQKQRLALARGLVAARDSSLLLLDEPTSSVDLVTESAIFDRMFTLYADKAIVATVHRLHLLPRFDVIGVMQDGLLMEIGSFPDLISQRNLFYRLWQNHLAQSVGEGDV
jgi:ABC-type multidrug transport system fused ATPase/permease subunit